MQRRKNKAGNHYLCTGRDNTCGNNPGPQGRCGSCVIRAAGFPRKSKLTRNDFIERSNFVHDNKYTYDETVYSDNKRKVIICCPQHGNFNQSPDNHMKGRGCPKCAPTAPQTTAEWIATVTAVHNGKYQYPNAVLIDSYTMIKILCPTHGEFEQLPGSHKQGKGCQQCGIELNAERCRKDINHFLEKAQKCHGDKYDYSKVVYTGSGTNVIITCKKCKQDFEQTPDNHYNGKGCSNCVKSHLEDAVTAYLGSHNIRFREQERFEDCVDTRPLPFDFYLPQHNLLIETDGQQHFQAIGYWKGEDGLQTQIRRDNIKDQWCLDNNYHLLRISYEDLRNIPAILDQVFIYLETICDNALVQTPAHTPAHTPAQTPTDYGNDNNAPAPTSAHAPVDTDCEIIATKFYRNVTIRDTSKYNYDITDV